MKQSQELAPLYQGQIDIFCAPYAVINALRFMHGIRPLEGRRLLHEALLDVAGDIPLFEEVLDQRTDYTFWVDAMLARQVRKGGILVETPFERGRGAQPGLHDTAIAPGKAQTPEGSPDANEVWDRLAAWLAGGVFRCALFQFVRYLPIGGGLIRHWTCCRAVEGDELVLYDCSREPGALQRILRQRLISTEAEQAEEKVLLVPWTVRLVRTRLS